MLREFVSGRSSEHGHFGLFLGDEFGRAELPIREADVPGTGIDVVAATEEVGAPGTARSASSSCVESVITPSMNASHATDPTMISQDA